MKRTLCMLLAFVLFFATCKMPALAAEINEEEKLPIEEVIADIQETYPNATITVDNGVINVVVPESTQQTTRAVSQVYAPSGGTWTNFVPPAEYVADPNLLRPYSIAFLPVDRADILRDAMREEIIREILYDGGDQTTAQIKNALEDATGEVYSDSQIIFMINSVSTGAFAILNYNSLNNAINSSSTRKVYIQFCTSGGWPSNFYYAWTTNYAFCSPWEAFEPQFRSGYFNIGSPIIL